LFSSKTIYRLSKGLWHNPGKAQVSIKMVNSLSLSKEENTKSTKLTITSEIYQDIENDTIQNSLFWIDIKQSFLIECTSEKKSKWKSKSKSLLVAFPIDLLSDATWVNVYGLVIFSYTYKYIRLYAYIDTRTRRTNQ